MAGTDQNVPILGTKLYRPLVTADFVPREALEARLNAGIELPLTVVSAPAGYGKSTLVSHWLETCGFPGAWLSLDDSDSDVRVFLSYLVAAVRTVSAGACSEFLNILNAENLPPLQVVAAYLSNELDTLEERLILVLDDYYRIREPAIHTLIDRLLEHPHRFLHLAIVSRRDPVLSLASLRARHMLNEIRIKDLAFSSDETLTFFRQAVGHSVDASTIDRLHEHTEGWPVAIRLAALALRNQDDIDGFLSRYGADARPLHEYLVAEVLSGQPELVRSQLLDTSVLRRFNASLCEAVWTNESDDKKNSPSGKNFIKILETSGLFCVALDGRREWFRFHHLFRDLLIQQSEETRSKEEISGLHQRASRWFETNGYFEEAIHHALAGGDEEHAAEIVGYARHELMNRDQWHRLERWLKLFSHDTVQQHPQLMVLRCWLGLSHWYRLDFLVKDLHRTDALLETSSIGMRETCLLKTEVSVIYSSLAYWTVNPSLAVTLTEPALSDASGEQEYVQSVALMYQGGALQLLGDLQQAERLIRDHIGEERFKNPGSQARILQALCFIYWCEADTRKLQQAARRLLEISINNELSWSLSFARYFLGLICYERNELSDAAAQLEIIVEAPYRYPIQNVTHCSFLLSLVYQAQGLPDRAREVANTINKITFERGNRMFIDLAEAFQADLELRQGRFAQAEQWARAFEIPASHTLHRFFNAELTSIRVMMARDTPNSRKLAAEQLESLHKLLSRAHNRRLLIDALGMKALIADVEGDTDSAVISLQDAVLLGQPGRLIRPLADLGPGLVKLLNRLDLDQEGLQYVGKILSTLQESAETTTVQSGKQPLIEALSHRELEILDLFARNLSNNEIAGKLFISTGTVKRHAHNIYGKLSVSGRRDAVSKAIGLGILKSL